MTAITIPFGASFRRANYAVSLYLEGSFLAIKKTICSARSLVLLTGNASEKKALIVDRSSNSRSTTRALSQRFQEHQAGNGSSWTELHPPVRLVESIRYDEEDLRLEEDKITYKLMEKYGVDKVRGGQFARSVFTQEQQFSLQQTLRHSIGACLRCGRPTHYASDCSELTDIHGTTIKISYTFERSCPINSSTGNSNVPFCPSTPTIAEVSQSLASTPTTPAFDSDPCARCGRSTHDDSECDALTDIHGSLCDDEDNV
ncbi:predicted protein [Phaeodactylum tricornutum CCAP 1055/1]|uniref:CCHC-type domain-containing protein n=1 Tax=Phaeodactylum tricornutum (strain CCAP 1055/1) TaxID=556484 RepID=B5Y439_PHATC|nr:predicted protein [Phaeodactylum tricornutum CCAP 1055/1]ACI65243.1 predicted protein [Phaeodactylum tricornutum CCAP 1055/1]|eukprot:XP_002185773.1 predicted protein [Phaeodactylum tricornutum CCAP 1055/1]